MAGLGRLDNEKHLKVINLDYSSIFIKIPINGTEILNCIRKRIKPSSK